MEKYISSN